MSEENPEYRTKTPKKTVKKFTGIAQSEFRIDGKRYKKGEEYSTTDEHRFKKLIRIKKVNK